MLNQVLDYLNNHFEIPERLITSVSSTIYPVSSALSVVFTADDTITGDFSESDLVAGDYIRIIGSNLNDYVFKISSKSDTVIKIDTTVDYLIETEASVEVSLNKCYIKKPLLGLIADIKTWNDNNSQSVGITSESIDDYSVTFDKSTIVSGWQGAFYGKLSQYRKKRW